MVENQRMPLAEIFLGELIIFMLIWFLNQDVARLFTMLLPCLFGSVLLISLLAELMEKSKVPRIFFYIMAISTITPLIAGGIMVYLGGMEAGFGSIILPEK